MRDTLIRLARWVSIAAHPFAITLALAATLELERGVAAATRTTAAVGILFVLPLAMITAVQVRRGAWQTVDASQPHERPVLFLVGASGLLAVLLYFAHTQPGSALVAGVSGVVIMVGVCAALTPWLKVSLHMAAASLAAIILLERGHPLGWVLAALLPLLAWSRVALGRHRWSEAAAGLLIGAAAGIIIARQ